MKAQKLIIAFISPLFLLASCEKDGEMAADFPYLSIDSLKILQTNIPVALYTDLTFLNENVGFAVSNFGAINSTVIVLRY